MPASLRWAGVIGVGAPVSGSAPEAALGKAMTARIGSAPAVPAEGDAAVRRRAVLERVEQEAELGAGLFLAQPDYVEDLLLHGLLVYTDRAAADLVAVADHVVGVGQRGAWLSGELVRPIRQGRGERVVHRGPAAGVGLLEHRGVDHPQERPQGGVDQAAAVADLQAGRAEQFL